MKTERSTVTVNIPKDLHYKCATIALKRRARIQEVVTKAVERYVNSPSQQKDCAA